MRNKQTIHRYVPHSTHQKIGATRYSDLRSILNNGLTSIERARNELLSHDSKLSIEFNKLYELIYSEVINNKNGIYSNRVIFTGVGKNANLATKASETFASLGIPTMYLNSCHGPHGDLGLIGPNDIVIHISMSGTTEETIKLTKAISNMQNERGVESKQVLITGTEQKYPIHNIILVCPGITEMHSIVKAPTSSTLVFMYVLDALGVLISHSMKITESDFHVFHPGGALGKMYKDL